MPRYVYTPEDPAYPTMGQEFFTFLNRHAPNTYSSRSLMSVIRQVDAHEAPLIVFDADPAAIDRRTEVKQGGLNSAAIVLRDGRILMCTHQDKRRTGFGAAVFHEVYRRRRALAQQDVHICAWVAASNIDGQRFLIARNMRIIATKAGDGQVCYGPPDRDE